MSMGIPSVTSTFSPGTPGTATSSSGRAADRNRRVNASIMILPAEFGFAIVSKGAVGEMTVVQVVGNFSGVVVKHSRGGGA